MNYVFLQLENSAHSLLLSAQYFILNTFTCVLGLISAMFLYRGN